MSDDNKEKDNKMNNDINNEQALSIDEVLTNLKIISQIKKGEKLLISKDILEIDNTNFQFLRRYFTGNSREATLKYFDSLIERAFELIDITYNSKNKNSNNNYFNEENSRILQRFSIEMTNSCKGLNNLKETYTDDITTTSQLEIMVDKLIRRIEKIQKILKIN